MTPPAPAQIIEALREVREHLRRFEAVVVVHPDDLTGELRRAVEATPLATLRESKHIVPGKLLVLHPGLIEDLCDVPPDPSPEERIPRPRRGR